MGRDTKVACINDSEYIVLKIPYSCIFRCNDVQEIQKSEIKCIVKLLVGINYPRDNQTTGHNATSSESRVDQTSAEEFAHLYDMRYCEIDLNTESNIIACFAKLAKQMIDTTRSNPHDLQDSLRLEDNQPQRKQQGFSCC